MQTVFNFLKDYLKFIGRIGNPDESSPGEGEKMALLFGHFIGVLFGIGLGIRLFHEVVPTDMRFGFMYVFGAVVGAAGGFLAGGVLGVALILAYQALRISIAFLVPLVVFGLLLFFLFSRF